MIIQAFDLACGYKEKAIIKDVNFVISSGDAVCILGPNGIGKTTLFKTILRNIRLVEGKIEIDGKSIYDYRLKQYARQIAYVPQATISSLQYTALDMVLMSRSARINAFSSPSKQDIDIARRALEWIGIEHLSNRNYHELSGGEQQCVLIARAIAQDSEAIILDEPTSNLDIKNQKQFINCITTLRNEGRALLFASHDPNYAFACANKVLTISKEGVKYGDTDIILNQSNLIELYGTNVKLIEFENEGKTTKCCYYL